MALTISLPHNSFGGDPWRRRRGFRESAHYFAPSYSSWRARCHWSF